MERDDEVIGFKINKDYAKHYGKWRKGEELQKYKDRYGDAAAEGSSSDESEDETAEALTPAMERDWLRVIAMIKAKDPKIRDKNYKFFHESSKSSSSVEDGEKKSKPMFPKDYERKIVLEKGGIVDEEENLKHNVAPGYYEEQEAIKASIKSAVQGVEGSDAESDDDLLTKRVKTKQELEKEEEDYIQWLKGQKDELEEDEKQVGVELTALKDYWQDPNLTEGEKFLRDYILNKDFKKEDEFEVDLEEAELSDQEQIHKEREFEHKYNFRFEDPDQDFIKRYPRSVENSLRRENKHRAEHRQMVKERKEQEKKKRVEEINQMRNMMRREILDKIDQIKTAAGKEIEQELDPNLFDEDFDPEKHDQLMKQMFNDEYYSSEKEKEKPVFDDDLDDIEDDFDKWDGPTQEQEKGESNEVEEDNVNNEEENGMDAGEETSTSHNKKKKKKKNQTEQELSEPKEEMEWGTSKRKRVRKSKLAQALMKKKPVYDPDEKTFEEYYNEYYKLDFEDLIGDIPCRFKYRSVPENDFGLSIGEIMSAKESELNKWASLKKCYQYRSKTQEERDRETFERLRNQEDLKRRVFLSLTREEEGLETPAPAKKPRQRSKKKRGKGGGKAIALPGTTDLPTMENNDAPKPKAKKRKHTHRTESDNQPSKKKENGVAKCDNTDQMPPNTNDSSPKKKKKENAQKMDGNKNIGNVQQKEETTGVKDMIVGSKGPGKDGDSIKKRKKNRNKDKKNKKTHEGNAPVNKVSEERLKAYGLNPTKMKYTHPQHVQWKSKKGS